MNGRDIAMSREYRLTRARRVVTGLDDEGRSTILSDGLTETRLLTDAFARNDIWQATSVPGSALAENTLGETAVIPPPPMGYTYNITSFPPDKEWDYEAGYARALATAAAADSTSADDVPGMHTTETVDIVTILSGELWAIVETGETLLSPGDTLVQRGTKHAWQNRGDVPAVMVAIQISATRP
jgi:mannose-6-phosphate isomerase-like protein (cupin superfamily)